MLRSQAIGFRPVELNLQLDLAPAQCPDPLNRLPAETPNAAGFMLAGPGGPPEEPRAAQVAQRGTVPTAGKATISGGWLASARLGEARPAQTQHCTGLFGAAVPPHAEPF